jgi:hypothetical protein
MRKEELPSCILGIICLLAGIAMLISGYVIAPSNGGFTADELRGIKVFGYIALVIGAVVVLTVAFMHFYYKKHPDKIFIYTPEQLEIQHKGYMFAFLALGAYVIVEGILRSVYKIEWSSYLISAASGLMMAALVYEVYCLLHGVGMPVKTSKEEIEYATSWFVVVGVDVYYLIRDLKDGYKIFDNGKATYLFVFILGMAFFAAIGFLQLYKGYSDQKKEQDAAKPEDK